MDLTDWTQDDFFKRGKVRYLKSYNGETYRDINERFFYTYVLCVAFVKKIEDGKYIGFIKEDSRGGLGIRIESDSEESALLKVDIRLAALGYKVNHIGI